MLDFTLSLERGNQVRQNKTQSLVLKQLEVINMQELPTDKNSSPILPLVVNLEEHEKIIIYMYVYI